MCACFTLPQIPQTLKMSVMEALQVSCSWFAWVDQLLSSELHVNSHLRCCFCIRHPQAHPSPLPGFAQTPTGLNKYLGHSAKELRNLLIFSQGRACYNLETLAVCLQVVIKTASPHQVSVASRGRWFPAENSCVSTNEPPDQQNAMPAHDCSCSSGVWAPKTFW